MAKEDQSEQVEEISLEEFVELETEIVAVKGKSTIELLAKLAEKAMSTKAVKLFIEKSHSAAYSRLVNLEKKGYVEKRFDKDRRCFWMITEEGRMFLESKEK